MKTDTTKAAGDVADEKLFDNWFDPVETGLRAKVRGFIETMIEEELDTALSRPRYGRRLELTADKAAAPIVGHRHGHRMRSLTGTVGPTQIAVPRAGSSVGKRRRSGRANRCGPISGAQNKPKL